MNRLAEWVRANPVSLAAPGIVAVLLGGAWLLGASLIMTGLIALVLAGIYSAIMFVLVDARPIAREVATAAAAKRVGIAPAELTPLVAKPAYRAPTYAVSQAPSTTWSIPALPQPRINLDDESFSVPMPPPLPPTTGAKVQLVPGQSVPWPFLNAQRVVFTEPIPVGVTELGEIVNLVLKERNILIAGETGGGKSTILRMLIAAAALDPHVRLSLFDAKLVELAKWKGVADRWVGDDIPGANRLLTQLRAEMRRRYAFMEANGLDHLDPSPEHPLEVLVIDELAEYCDDDEFVTHLMKIVGLGRAAGIVTIVATVEPRHDVVPAKLRNKFVFRWAMRCADVAQVRMIIGGRYKQAPAHLIDAADKGTGFLMHEGAEPVRLLSFWLSPEDVGRLATRAEALRRSGPEAGPKRGGPEMGLSVDEAARSVPEATASKVREAYDVFEWSESRIAKEILGYPAGGTEYQKGLRVVRAIVRGNARTRLRIVNEGEEDV